MDRRDALKLNAAMEQFEAKEGADFSSMQDHEFRFEWDTEALAEQFRRSGQSIPHLGEQITLAAISGCLDAVAFMLKAGVPCDTSDELQMTALHYASWRGFSKIVDILLAAGSDVNRQAFAQLTPLTMAVNKNRTEVVKRLLAVKAINVNAKSTDGMTALHAATGRGFTHIIQLLLSAGANINTKTVQLVTPLHFVIQEKHMDAFQALLAAGADVHVADEERNSPLHTAAQENSPPMIRALLAKSADVNARSTRLATPLHYATLQGHAKAALALLEAGAEVNALTCKGQTALHFAAAKTDVEEGRRRDVARALIGRGRLHVDAMDYSRRSALHVAAEGGQMLLLAFLLDEAKADVNVGAATNQRTPLHAAVDGEHARFEVVDTLLKNGADSNATDELGRTPLHLAAEHADLRTVKLLLSSGAYHDLKSETARHVLPAGFATLNANARVAEIFKLVDLFFVAVCKNDLDNVRVCLKSHRFVVNCRSCHYMTSLHYPAWKGFVELARLLLSQGAKVNDNSKRYGSPLHYALKYNQPEVAIDLLKYGAMYDVVCPISGKTPLQTAELGKCGGLVPILATAQRIFGDVETGNPGVIKELKVMRNKKPDEFLVLQKMRNSLGLKLLDVALKNCYEDIAACLK